MMRKYFTVFVLVFLIVGCMHFNDPRPKHYRASVKTVDNSVCVMVQPENDEKLISLIIEEVGNTKNRVGKFYYDDALVILPGECIPSFGYKFDAGKSYSFSIILESASKRKKGAQPASRIYGTSFTLRNDNGDLEVNVIF